MVIINNCRICMQVRCDLGTVYAFKGNKYLPRIIYDISGVKISQQREPVAKICATCKAAVVAAEGIILQCQASEQHILYDTLDIRKRASDEQCLEHFEMAKIDCDNFKVKTSKVKKTIGNFIPLNVSSKGKLRYNIVGLFERHCDPEKSKPASEPMPKYKKITNLKNSKCKRVSNTQLKNAQYMHKCEICDFQTMTRRSFINHLLVDHFIDDSNIYPCTLCSKKFAWRRLLFKHIEEDHKQLPEEKKFMCDKCGRTYTLEIHLLNHRKQRHDSEFHKCPHSSCKSKFNRISSLRRHFNNTHSEVKRFNCETCDKHFAVWDNWSYHMNVVHQHTKMMCPKCLGPFCSQKKLHTHMLMGACDNWVFQCEFCKRRFLTQTAWRTHVHTFHK